MRERAVLVHGSRAAIARAFALVAELQPVAWTPDGLVVIPAIAGDPGRAERALARLPLETSPHRAPTLAPWPDPPASWSGGIYRRSPGHACAPDGVPEIVQSAGSGFGPGDHATTTMCLERLRLLPDGAALDAGCGSGLLALAWARLGKGPVLAVDADPDAARQATASARMSGLEAGVEVRAARLDTLDTAELDGRVLLANVPVAAHRQIADLLGAPPPAALLSGLCRGEARGVLDRYARLGLRRAGVARRGRWECHLLMRDDRR